jgi:hypothetical protein
MSPKGPYDTPVMLRRARARARARVSGVPPRRRVADGGGVAGAGRRQTSPCAPT